MTLIKGLRRRVTPLFNPGTLQLNAWYRDYTGTQYNGVASTGTSGAVPGTLAASPQPTSGTLSGFATSVWTQGSGSVITTSTASNVLFPTPTTSGFIASLVNPNTTVADPGVGVRYKAIGLWSDSKTYNTNLYMGTSFTDSGPAAYLYNGSAYKDVICSNAPTGWMAIFQWWDGTNLNIQVNNGAPSSVACTSTSTSPSSNPVFLGKGFTSAALSFGGSIAEWMASPANLSGSIPNIYSYFKGRYPGAGLP